MKSIKEQSEELWDEFSQNIGDDIDALSYFAGRDVITEQDFHKAIEKLSAPSQGEATPLLTGEEHSPTK